MEGSEDTGWYQERIEMEDTDFSRVCECGKFIILGKANIWVHLNGDTWCAPKQDPWSVEYSTAKPKEKE